MYKQTLNRDGSIANCVIRILDSVAIPSDPTNTDYQEYLKWVAEGNTPEAAE